MPSRKLSNSEIAEKLADADRWLAAGVGAEEILRRLGVTKITYNRWRRQFGRERSTDRERLRRLEAENAALRRRLFELEPTKAPAYLH